MFQDLGHKSDNTSGSQSNQAVEDKSKLVKMVEISDFRRFLSKLHLTGEVIKPEWWKMQDYNPLETILYIFASTLLKNRYFLGWKEQKKVKTGFIWRYGLIYVLLWLLSFTSPIYDNDNDNDNNNNNELRFLVMHNLLRLFPEKGFCI